MKLKTLHLGQLLTNCYIVAGESGCVIIDPGAEADKIKDAVNECGLPCTGIFVTHSHDDHIGALCEIYAEYRVPVYVSKEADLGTEIETVPLDDGDEIKTGGMKFKVMSTPGHTSDSVCFISGDIMFSGDTLFKGTIGRTDLGGSIHDMMNSLERIASIDDDEMLVLPGHGFRTTLGREKAGNPYLNRGVN